MLIDNAVSTACLRSSQTATRRKKLETLALKIHLWFNSKIYFLPCTGRAQFADFCSRLLGPDNANKVSFPSDQSILFNEDNMLIMPNLAKKVKKIVVSTTYPVEDIKIILTRIIGKEEIEKILMLLKIIKVSFKVMLIDIVSFIKIVRKCSFIVNMCNVLVVFVSLCKIIISLFVSLQYIHEKCNNLLKIKQSMFELFNGKIYEPLIKIGKITLEKSGFKFLPIETSSLTREFSELFSVPEFVRMQIEEGITNDVDPRTLKYHKGKIILPRKLFVIWIAMHHSSLSHPGWKRLYNYLNHYYHFKNKSLVQDICKNISLSCYLCLLSNPPSHKNKVGSAFDSLIKAPGDTIMYDLLEMSSEANKVGGLEGVQAIMIIIDLYSRYVTLYPLRDKTQIEIIQKLCIYFGQNGIPKRTISDNGPGVAGSKVKKFLSDLHIISLNSSPHSSASRGAIETKCKMVNTQLRKSFVADDKLTFLTKLPAISFSHNHFPIHASKSYLTPYNIQHFSLKTFEGGVNQPISTMFNGAFKSNEQGIEQKLTPLAKNLRLAIQETIKNLRDNQEKILAKANKNKLESKIQLNDYCVIRKFHTGPNWKLKPLFSSDFYRVIGRKRFILYLENALSKQVVIRHQNDVKRLSIEFINKYDYPPHLAERLKILTAEDLEHFMDFPSLINRKEHRFKINNKNEVTINPTKNANNDNNDEDDENDYLDILQTDNYVPQDGLSTIEEITETDE